MHRSFSIARGISMFLLCGLYANVVYAQSNSTKSRARELADSAYAMVDQDTQRAAALARTAIDLARSENDQGALHDGLNALRYAHFLNGENAAVLERSLEALRIARAMGSERAMGDDHGWIATALIEAGREEEGFAHAQQAMVHMRLAKDSAALANGLCDLSNAARHTGRSAAALDHIAEASRIYVALHDDAGAAFAHGLRANLFVERGQWSDALPFLHKAMSHTAVAGTPLEKAWLERDLALVNAHLDRFDEARAYLDSAEYRLKALNAVNEMQDVHQVRMVLYERQGDLSKALAQARVLLQLKDSLNKANINAGVALSTASSGGLDRMEREAELVLAQEQNAERIKRLEGRQSGWMATTAIGVVLLILVFVLLVITARNKRTVASELDAALDLVDELRGHRASGRPAA